MEDNIDPVITCLASITQANDPGICAAIVHYSAATATDNCSAAVTYTQASGTSFPVGTTTVTATATDPSGNTAECDFTVTVNDTEAPGGGGTATYPAPTNILANVAEASGYDMVYQLDIPNGSNWDVQSQVPYAVNNAAALASATYDRIAYYMELDNEWIWVSVPAFTADVSKTGIPTDWDFTGTLTDMNVFSNKAGIATGTGINTGNIEFWDNCYTTDNLFNIPGASSSTFDFGDNNQNNADCYGSFQIHNYDAGQTLFAYNKWTGSGTSDLGIGNSPTGHPDWTFRGNANTYTVKRVYVFINSGSNFSCLNPTVAIDASGNASITVADIDDNNSDNCGITSMSLDVTSFDCSNVGANTVVLSASDAAGNTATCSATVTIEDNTLPVAVCQDITIDLDASGSATITAADVDGGPTDACGIDTRTVNTSSFTCSDVGTNTVTLTVTDNNGNSSTCNATVTVEDNVAPTINCPDDISANATSASGAVVNYMAPVGTDNCPNPVTNQTAGQASGSTFPIGTTTNTFEVTDASGNTATCSFTVTINGVAPDITCPNPITVNNDLGLCGAIVTYEATDTTAIPPSDITYDINPGSFFNVGTTTVTATATNAVGSDQCSFTVTVVDNEVPDAMCQNITIELDATGNKTILPSVVDDGSDDNCAVANLELDDDSFDCADVGTNTVTLTVTDVNNNSSSCTSTVTVQDNTAPIAACLNPTISLNAYGQASISTSDVFDEVNSSDACGKPYPTLVNPSIFDCEDIGAHTVTLQIIDLIGNTADCNATVTIVDGTPPTVICKNTTVTLNSQGQAILRPIEVYDSGSDNCGNVNLESVTPNSFDCSNTGNTPVTLTVNDGHGNTATCTATVTIFDTVFPTALCQNITVGLYGNGQDSISTADVDNGSFDNCAIANMNLSETAFDCDDIGTTTVTLTVSDYAGNSTTCTANVTIEDNLPPLAICQDLTIDLNPDGNYTLDASQINNGSSDNCTNISYSVDPSQFDCSDVGSNTVTLTVTDDNNNSSTCTASLTINSFISINNVNVTHESCLGYGDGQIEIIAAATGGGQLRYSID